MEHSKGFTIIELLMVIAIITILPVVIISNFPQVKLQFALSRAAHTFAQDVREAQGMALSSLPFKDSFGIAQPVGGYGVYVDVGQTGSKKYIVYADRLPVNNRYDASDYLVKTIDISLSEPGVIISGLGNDFLGRASINFAVGSANVSLGQIDAIANALEVIFTLESDTTKTKSVLINTSGLIEIK